MIISFVKHIEYQLNLNMPLCKYHKLIEESVDKRDWVAYWLEFGTSGMLILP